MDFTDLFSTYGVRTADLRWWETRDFGDVTGHTALLVSCHDES